MAVHQRTNYLAITISLAIAGLIVFAAYKIDSSRQETARAAAATKAAAEQELRILLHVAQSVGVRGNTPKEVAANENTGQEGFENNDSLQAVSEAADKLSNNIDLLADIEAKFLDEQGQAEATKQREEIEANLNELSSRWVSDVSTTTTYDSLITSGDFYRISSAELRGKLTELTLMQKRLRLLEKLHVRFVDRELRPFLSGYESRYLSVFTEAPKGNQKLRQSAPLPNDFYISLLGEAEFASLIEDLKFFTRQIRVFRERIDGEEDKEGKKIKEGLLEQTRKEIRTEIARIDTENSDPATTSEDTGDSAKDDS